MADSTPGWHHRDPSSAAAQSFELETRPLGAIGLEIVTALARGRHSDDVRAAAESVLERHRRQQTHVAGARLPRPA